MLSVEQSTCYYRRYEKQLNSLECDFVTEEIRISSIIKNRTNYDLVKIGTEEHRYLIEWRLSLMENDFFGFIKRDGGNIKDMKDRTLVVKTSSCPQNHPCPSVKVCPVGALTQKGFNAPTVNIDTCIKCGKCVKFCPKRALVME